MKLPVLAGAALSLGASLCSATLPPWSDGLESYSGSLGGEWYANSGYFSVVSSGNPFAGSRHLRLDAASFADYGNLSGMYGWEYSNTSGVAANVTYTPIGNDPSVVTLTGWAKIDNLRAGQRPVALAYEFLNPFSGTLSKILIYHDGTVDCLSVYGYDNVGQYVFFDYASTGSIVSPSSWNKLTIRVDFTNGAVRFELNDSFLFLTATNAGGIGGFICDTAALRKVPASNIAQPKLYFDEINVVASGHCDGDLNLDGVVDDADMVVFVAQYDVNNCADLRAAVFCSADLNKDGFADDADFSVFALAYDAMLCP